MTKTFEHRAITLAKEVYDAAEVSGELRDLFPHEQALLTAVHDAGMERAKTIGCAVRQFGDHSLPYDAAVYLAGRQHDDALNKAVAAFEAAEAQALIDLEKAVDVAVEAGVSFAPSDAEYREWRWTDEAKHHNVVVL